MKPTPIEKLKEDLASIPEVRRHLDRPRSPRGTWWLDVQVEGRTFAVAWSPDHGFGLSEVEDDERAAYGEGHDEAYRTRRRVFARILALSQTGQTTVPPVGVLLRRLRERRDLTQAEIAQRLGRNQGAVSKLEGNANPGWALVQQYVAALGGKLLIEVDGEQIEIV